MPHKTKKPYRKKVKGSFKPFAIPGGRKKKKRKSRNVGGMTFRHVKNK